MLSQHQREAFDKITNLLNEGQKRIILKGGAGVGKTYLSNQVVDFMVNKYSPKWSQGLVYSTAPTNKALSILRSKIQNPKVTFSTVHSALKLKRHINTRTGVVTFKPEYDGTKSKPFEQCVGAIVDECSMLESRILALTDEYNFPIIFLGDDKQLNPIGENVSPIFTRGYPEVELTEIVRQGVGNPIIELSRDLDMIYFKMDNMVENKGYLFNDNNPYIIEQLAEAGGTDQLKYLAYTNDIVNSINNSVRLRLYGDSPNKLQLGEVIVFDNPYGDFYTNQEVTVDKLEVKELPIKIPNAKTKFNIDGTWVNYDTIKIKCYIVNSRIIIPHEESDTFVSSTSEHIRSRCTKYGWNWKAFYLFNEQFAYFKYNHAITIHKSQGSTYSEAILNVSDIDINRNAIEKPRLLYTGVTRASNILILNNVK